MRNTLGQITPLRRGALSHPPSPHTELTGKVKAAVIVRLLLAEGASCRCLRFPNTCNRR